MDIIGVLRQKAQQELKRIVLPEISDQRTIDASIEIVSEKLAKLVLVGDYTEAKIQLISSGADLKLVTFYNPEENLELVERYALMLTEKRKHR